MRRRSFVVHGALLAAAACGPLRRSGPPAAEIIFSNESLDQADVYAVASSGAQIRIGTVMPGRKETLRIPPGALGGDNSANIVARILAKSRTPSSGPITLNPGDRMQVTLSSDERVLSVLPAREP